MLTSLATVRMVATAKQASKQFGSQLYCRSCSFSFAVHLSPISAKLANTHARAQTHTYTPNSHWKPHLHCAQSAVQSKWGSPPPFYSFKIARTCTPQAALSSPRKHRSRDISMQTSSCHAGRRAYTLPRTHADRQTQMHIDPPRDSTAIIPKPQINNNVKS